MGYNNTCKPWPSNTEEDKTLYEAWERGLITKDDIDVCKITKGGLVMEDMIATMETAFNDFVSDDLVKAAAEEQLLPAGTYEGVVDKFEVREIAELTQAGTPHPFFGKSIYRVTVTLYIDGRERKHWIDVTADKLFSKSGAKLVEASILGVQFAKATGERSLSAALTKAMLTRLKYTLTRSEGSNGYSAKNWTKVSA